MCVCKMERILLAIILVSLTWRGCMSVMCYWCSGVGDDRECENRPYAVRTGPVYLNCRANFCLSAKVIDAATGHVLSFARLCDNIPRGNMCIRDTKLLTCYESCTSDLCNNGNPSPLHLPTVNYAGDEILPRDNYHEVQTPTRTKKTSRTPLPTDSLNSQRNIKLGPRRDLWQTASQSSTQAHRSNSTHDYKFPFYNVMSPTLRQTGNKRNPRTLKQDVAKKMMKVDQVSMSKHPSTVHAATVFKSSVNMIPFTSGLRPDAVERGTVGVNQVSTIAKIVKQPIPSVTESIATINANAGNRDVPTKPREKEFNSTYTHGGKRHINVTRNQKSVDHLEPELLLVKGFEVDNFEDVIRAAKDVTAWPGSPDLRELDELRRKAVLQMEDDKEESLVQTFRAKTTQTTAGPGRMSSKVNKEETNLFPTNGTTIVERRRDLTVSEEKKSSPASTSTVALPLASSTTRYRTVTFKTTTSRKTTATVPISRSGSSKTTLPYIWREKSSWNEDGTLNEKITVANGSKNQTGRKKHHRKVQLYDLQTTEDETVDSVPRKFNKTRLTKPLQNGEGDIYLKQSLSENLHGIRQDFHDETKAEFTSSRATGASGGTFIVSIASMLVYLSSS